MTTCRDTFDHVTHYGFVPLAIIFNFLLLFVVRTKSTTDLNAYKIVINISCLSDLFNAFLAFFMDLHINVMETIPMFYLNGWIIRFVPHDIRHYLLALYLGAQMSTINVSTPPFIYRFCLVCKNKQIPQRLLLLIYTIFILPIIIYSCLNSYLRAKYSHVLASQVTPQMIESCPNSSYLTGYRTQHVDGVFDKTLNHTSTAITVLNQLCFVIIFVCDLKILRFLRQNRALVRNPQMQSDIEKTLMVQAFFPLVICGLPSIAGHFLILACGPRAFSIIRYTFGMYAWIPCFNPLITFYYIKPYRQSFMGLLRSRQYITTISTQTSANRGRNTKAMLEIEL